jgi:hypothetical protein
VNTFHVINAVPNIDVLVSVLTSATFFNVNLYRNVDEFDGFPVTAEPIWILGIKYNLMQGMSLHFCCQQGISLFNHCLVHQMNPARY